MPVEIAYLSPQLSGLLGEPLAHYATEADAGRIESCVYAVRHRRCISDEIKIGRTRGYLKDRLSHAASQLCYGYADPADLEIVCVLRCVGTNTPEIIDRAIRSALREVNVQAGRGREWYLVSNNVLAGQISELARTGGMTDYAPSRLHRRRPADDPLAVGIKTMMHLGDAPLQIPTCFADYGEIEDLRIEIGCAVVTSTVCLTHNHYDSANGRCRYDCLDLPGADAISGHLVSYVRSIWRNRRTRANRHALATGRVQMTEYLVPQEGDDGILLYRRDIACRL